MQRLLLGRTVIIPFFVLLNSIFGLEIITPKLLYSQVLAFPSAEGFGRFSQGGRGGVPCFVTNLNASGAGSFQACLTLNQPRTIIFRVGGTINMGTCETCVTIPPYLTIAGQTAPGDGIMIRGMELGFYNTHNIILRHLRVRPGDMPTPTGGTSFGAIECAYSHDVIYDHYSAGWIHDDTVGAESCQNITYQWGIVSEGLGCPNCTDGSTSKVGMTTYTGGTLANTGASWLHNFWAHHHWRVPAANGGKAQMVNNVIYNTGQGTWVSPCYNGTPPTYLELINSYYQHGPQTITGDGRSPGLELTGTGWPGANCSTGQSLVYLSGNYNSRACPSAAAACQRSMVIGQPGDTSAPANFTFVSAGLGFPTIGSQTSASQARTDALAKSGAYATMTPSRRDSIDLRAINSMINNSGGQFDVASVAQFGGYPVYNTGTPYPDTDGDGIADSWETSHGLNPNNAADGPLIASNGYSNLENFLNELAGDTVGTPLPAPTNMRLLSITPSP